MELGGATRPQADLVLEAGGVKGLAFAGALGELARAGYRFPRIAGTSSGAISGAVLAALEHAGEPPERLLDVARTMDLRRFRDLGWGHHLGPFHFVAEGARFVLSGGLYQGRYLHDWVAGVLRDLGVRTFADLRRVDPGSGLPADRDYSFLAVTSDISEHRMSLLPWDYAYYGLDPDEQPVADAVRASAAIPFFYVPSILQTRTPRGAVTLVDGGLLSMYPITVFDQPGERLPRWPTFGIRLSARESTRAADHPIRHPVGIAEALIETMLEGWDNRHIDNPSAIARTIFVDTGGISGLDFDLTAAQREQLIDAGRAAAAKFLSSWDFDRWRATYHPGARS
ncbi:MAG TPA: patatin-like phospholipase family protein [Nocardioidaceae bacterium]|nr:patatin-like phospholipase family protein [Nocardioidaceae bacterium]